MKQFLYHLFPILTHLTLWDFILIVVLLFIIVRLAVRFELLDQLTTLERRSAYLEEKRKRLGLR